MRRWTKHVLTSGFCIWFNVISRIHPNTMIQIIYSIPIIVTKYLYHWIFIDYYTIIQYWYPNSQIIPIIAWKPLPISRRQSGRKPTIANPARTGTIPWRPEINGESFWMWRKHETWGFQSTKKGFWSTATWFFRRFSATINKIWHLEAPNKAWDTEIPTASTGIFRWRWKFKKSSLSAVISRSH